MALRAWVDRPGDIIAISHIFLNLASSCSFYELELRCMAVIFVAALLCRINCDAVYFLLRFTTVTMVTMYYGLLSVYYGLLQCLLRLFCNNFMHPQVMGTPRVILATLYVRRIYTYVYTRMCCIFHYIVPPPLRFAAIRKFGWVWGIIFPCDRRSSSRRCRCVTPRCSILTVRRFAILFFASFVR